MRVTFQFVPKSTNIDQSGANTDKLFQDLMGGMRYSAEMNELKKDKLINTYNDAIESMNSPNLFDNYTVCILISGKETNVVCHYLSSTEELNQFLMEANFSPDYNYTELNDETIKISLNN
jgi:hypothetical protein